MIDNIKNTDKKNAFQTVWKVEAGGNIGFNVSGDFFTIDWGDGTVEYINQRDLISTPDTYNELTSYTHVYANDGDYTVSIYGDPNASPRPGYDYTGMESFDMEAGLCDPKQLIEIKQWGNARLQGMSDMFWGAQNMVCTATDTPDTSEVDSMARAFLNCSKFNSPIEHWDVRRVTEMTSMLERATAFNQPLFAMDSPALLYVRGILKDAPAFDQDLRELKIKSVEPKVRFCSSTNYVPQDTPAQRERAEHEARSIDTDHMFGYGDHGYRGNGNSLADYNKIHAEKYDAKDQQEECNSVLASH